jgi:hypothetical protein
MNARMVVECVAVLMAVANRPADAQGSADATAPNSTLSALTAPSGSSLLRGQVAELFSVYVPRTPADIQQQLDSARGFQISAIAQIAQTRSLAGDADNRARVMREEIETSKTKRGIAKKAKDKPAVESLDATVKRQEDELQYLLNLREAMLAEADRLATEQAAVAARVKALQFETLVAKKNEELHSPLATSNAADQYQVMLRNLLDAQRDSAIKWREASEKDRKVAERRIEQLKALSRLQK